MKCSQCGNERMDEDEILMNKWIDKNDKGFLYRKGDSSLCCKCIIDYRISDMMDSVCKLRKLRMVMK